MAGPANYRIRDFRYYAHGKPLEEVFSIIITIHANIYLSIILVGYFFIE